MSTATTSCCRSILSKGPTLRSKVYWNEEKQNLIERNLLIEKYLPLITHISKILWGKKIARRLGEFEDLVSSGYESLIRAAELYNPKHCSHASFKTYAYRSILRAMLRAADESGIIRVPASTLRAVRAPNKKTKPQPEEVKRSVNCAISVVSIPDDYDSCIDGKVEERIWQEEIKEMVDCLPDEIREAVGKSFGIGKRQESVVKIGDDNGVTGQTIRQRRRFGVAQLGQALSQDGTIGMNEFI